MLSPRTLLALALALPPSSQAQNTIAAPPRPAPQPHVDSRALTVSPAAAPTPLLSYRFFPLASERTPGEAAPIYLRLSHEYRSAWPDLSSKPSEWLGLDLEAFPLAEARAFVDQHTSRLALLTFAAHRERCDWSYTIPEQREDVIEILLPDAQELRTWARLLVLEARVEIAEGKLHEAAHTIETGLSMARDVAEGPFLISDLVGMAIANQMLDRVEELAARTDAPNLYWALTALPRPLISVYDSMEYEQKIGEWMVPQLTQLNTPRTPAEWTSLLTRLHERLSVLAGKLAAAGGETQPADANGAKPPRPTDLEALRQELLPAAKQAFPEGDRSDDERVTRYLVSAYHELMDSVYASSYLSPSEMDGAKTRGEKAILEAKSAGWALALSAAIAAEARLTRRIAALRAIEAIRMQAAADDGMLPASLDAVTVVPVPIDPATARPFTYKVVGDSFLLSASRNDGVFFPMEYRVTLRK